MDNDKKQKCGNCLTEKPLIEFSIKSGKSESIVRWDKVCKKCKAEQIKSKRTKADSSAIKKTAKRIIEPVKKTKANCPKNINGFLKQGSFKDQLNFNDMKESYDTSPTDIECFDATERLNEFVQILREELSSETGNQIFIKKNK